MPPFSRVKLGVGRRGDVTSDAEQGAKGVERVESPVEAEGKLVEVGLEVLVADPVMRSHQPGLEAGEYEMDHRQVPLGHLWIAPLGDGSVAVAAGAQRRIGGPVVGGDRHPRQNSAFDEAAKRLRTAIRCNGQADAASVTAILALVELGARLALAHLDGAGHQDFVMNAAALAARPAANPGLIDLDADAGLAADAILIAPHHAGAQLVQDLEGGLVPRQAKLPLELHGGHAGRLAGHQIGSPKPHAQRRMGPLHHRACRQTGVAATRAAAHDATSIGEAKRVAHRAALGADEPIAPPRLLQVGGASRVIREKPLEFRE